MATGSDKVTLSIDSRLRILYAKRDRMYNRIQSICDTVKSLQEECYRETFLCELETLDSLRSDFENVLDKINELELHSNPKYVIDYQPLSSFDDLFNRVKRAGRSLQQPDLSKQPATQPRMPRLPPIEIPEFDGDIKHWPLFSASFENSVHNNPSLSDSEKLFYLIGKLTGKARSVCAGIVPSAQNYSLIFNLLKDKYEDKRLAATSYLDQIFELKSMSTATVNNLELFLDKFATSVAALKNFKFHDLSDFVFLHIALKKLDSDTARSFELDRRGSKMPTFDELVLFVRNHIKIIQRTSAIKHDTSKKNTDRRPDAPYRQYTHAYVNADDAIQPNSCSLCDLTHEHIYNCSVFHGYNPNERFKFVKSNGLCINCLGKGHHVSMCNSKSLCRKCSRKHHTLIHFPQNNYVDTDISSKVVNSSTTTHVSPPVCTSIGPIGDGDAYAGTVSRVPNDEVTLCSLSHGATNKYVKYEPTTVLLATARIIITDSHGTEHNVRALLDSASQSNFITRDCCRRLGLNLLVSSCSTVRGIGGSTKSVEGSVDINFSSRFNRNINYDMKSLVVDKITERLPTVSVNTSSLSTFRNLPLADETYSTSSEIDVLIGASIFPHLLLSKRIKCSSSLQSPIALETVLGYVIVGEAVANVHTNATVTCCLTSDALHSAVRKFWELEEINFSPVLSPDDALCEEFYTRTTTRDKDGRYMVSLPFKGNTDALGDSKKVCERRFLCLEKKMLASPPLKIAYDNVIREYLEKDYISLSSIDLKANDDSPSYFIPHHGVLREDKVTSKLRVVLDASCKTSTHISLNDILHSGPNIQGNLFSIIINFRLFAIALSADIRQMFLSIGVSQHDHRFQRILYRFTPNEPLRVYEFKRVCFGIKSSPYIALRTIRQLVTDVGDHYPLAKGVIDSGLYMDDFVYSVSDESTAIASASEMIGMMKAGQFDLVKWTSNSQMVLDSIPESHRLSSLKEFTDPDSHKILGLCWSPITDNFSLKIHSSVSICTKRIILSFVARLWDVMGFVAPVILYAKLLIKELWLCGCDWDDTPPESITKLWARYKRELPLLTNIQIPRYLDITHDSDINILAFADASERAYGGVVYFHVRNGSRTSIHLISAKSKVAPNKVISLARLELCAILLLVQLISNIVSGCQNRINVHNILAFSDSKVALCWVHSSPHRWDTFVANRVTKIQGHLSPENLYYIAGNENPADCLSRGLTPAQIINHPLWFKGPSWANLDSTLWPIVPFNPSMVSETPEERKHSLISTPIVEKSLIISLAERFSSWSRFLFCLVYICRFAKLLPRRKQICSSDLEFAELMTFRELQRIHFADVMSKLLVDRPCNRSVQHLKPFLDNGLIRVGGRLSNSDLDYAYKHPILLPRKGHIVNLLIDYHHKINCHAGPNLLMSLLRHRYWIISARNLIRSRIHKCLPCFRLKPKPTFPEMADHRACRVIQTSKPFVHTGTDYAGPFKVSLKRGRGMRTTKAYICLFVCMTTRAIHIELAGDLSTASFMGAFKRFISRRGPVSRLYSDNGTNFIGAKRKLSELHEYLCSTNHNMEFGKILAENRIDWTLNPPAASHFGGDWESNIKSLKVHLLRVIGDQILSFEEMSTVLAQIEAVMNSRPLCRTLSNDPLEPLALTPAHFLNLTPLKYLPASDIDKNIRTLSRHQLLDKLIQSFWKRWRRDYLHTLQSRYKWNTSVNPITVGTVVILITENCPPLHWPLGVVEEVFPGTDGVVRIVRIKTATGSYLRPVVRLCPIPN